MSGITLSNCQLEVVVGDGEIARCYVDTHERVDRPTKGQRRTRRTGYVAPPSICASSLMQTARTRGVGA